MKVLTSFSFLTFFKYDLVLRSCSVSQALWNHRQSHLEAVCLIRIFLNFHVVQPLFLLQQLFFSVGHPHRQFSKGKLLYPLYDKWYCHFGNFFIGPVYSVIRRIFTLKPNCVLCRSKATLTYVGIYLGLCIFQRFKFIYWWLLKHLVLNREPCFFACLGNFIHPSLSHARGLLSYVHMLYYLIATLKWISQ